MFDQGAALASLATVVLGSGKRIFPEDGAPRPLVDRQVTTTGAVLVTYARAVG